MVDVFEEIDEQIRSQRVEALLRNGWPFAAAAAGVALLAALGVWAWGQHSQAEQEKASIAYQSGLDAQSKGDIAGANKAFAALAASAPPAYRSLALMQEAQIKLSANQVDAAIGFLDKAAAVAPSPLIGDAARLKAAYLVIDTRPLSDAEARLAPLAAAKAPFRALALEALAMARFKAGKFDEAKGDFSVLTLSQDVSQSAQTRARAALDLIQSGSARSVPALAAAAAALPPQAPTQPVSGDAQ